MQRIRTVDSAPWWDALEAGRLIVQRCASCGTLRHYPRPMCPKCHDFAHEWADVSGRGLVHSWTVTHQTPLAGFSALVPYTIVTVDMEEGVRMLGRLLEASGGPLSIGLGVQAMVVPGVDGQPEVGFRRR